MSVEPIRSVVIIGAGTMGQGCDPCVRHGLLMASKKAQMS
jgi:hypothetical protein